MKQPTQRRQGKKYNSLFSDDFTAVAVGVLNLQNLSIVGKSSNFNFISHSVK